MLEEQKKLQKLLQYKNKNKNQISNFWVRKHGLFTSLEEERHRTTGAAGFVFSACPETGRMSREIKSFSSFPHSLYFFPYYPHPQPPSHPSALTAYLLRPFFSNSLSLGANSNMAVLSAGGS